ISHRSHLTRLTETGRDASPSPRRHKAGSCMHRARRREVGLTTPSISSDSLVSVRRSHPDRCRDRGSLSNSRGQVRAGLPERRGDQARQYGHRGGGEPRRPRPLRHRGGRHGQRDLRGTRPEPGPPSRSVRRPAAATQESRFREQIVPVDVPGAGRVEADEGIRIDTSLEKLAKLPPVFREDGQVTAGNASQLSDGGAAMVVLSREAADRHGITPLARVVAYNTAGVKPEWVMEAPIPGVRKLLKKTGLSVDDIDLFEHNEAYAAASLAVMRELGIPHEKLNVNGGAVALGHPIGCSGARVLTTLAYAMKDRGAKRGLATLCLGGGNAVSMIVERP